MRPATIRLTETGRITASVPAVLASDAARDAGKELTMNNRISQLAAIFALLVGFNLAGPTNALAAPPESSTLQTAPLGGSSLTFGRAMARSSWYGAVDLRGGEMSFISISGDGDTDLDLYIYDAAGNLIVASDGRSDDESVWVIPRVTGRFYIRVRNLGSVYNDFSVWVH